MHSHTFSFHTSDPAIASQIHALLSGGARAHTPPAPNAAAPVAGSVAGYAPPTPPAAPATFAPPVAPVPVPAPAPSAPAAPAAAAIAHDAQDLQTIAAGWTVDLMKSVATEYTQKHGPAGLKNIFAQFGAEKLATGPRPVAPKHYPAVHALLTA